MRITICKIAIILLACFQFTAPLLPIDFTWITCFLAITILLTALPIMDKSFLRAALVFLAAGSVLMLVNRQPLMAWVAGINSMLTVSSIVVIMQLFSIPIKVGDYHSAIERILSKRLNNQGSLFSLTTGITYLFSCFLNLGTIPIIFSLLGDIIKRNVASYNRFMIAALSRGFSLAVLWTPGTVIMVLALEVTGARWIDVFLPGLLLSFAGIITSYYMESKSGLFTTAGKLPAKSGEEGTLQNNSGEGNWSKIGSLFLVVGGLAAITAVFEKYQVSVGTTHRIMLAIIIIIFVWILFYIKNPNLGQGFKYFWRDGVTKAIDLAGLFVAMGIFSQALGSSSFMVWLQNILPEYADSINVLLPAVLPLTILLASMAGVHPLISVALIGKILVAIQIPISPHLAALSLVIGGVAAFMLSPFTGTVLIIAKFLNRHPLKIVAENWTFNLFYLAEGILLVYLLHIFI